LGQSLTLWPPKYFSEAQKHSFVRNPYLSQLCQELHDAYQKQKLDAFGLYVYGMILKEAQANRLPLKADDPPAHQILMESILQFPCNWSAWLDLAAVSLKDSQIEQSVERRLLPALGGHYMYHFFCAHLMSAHQAYEDALALYDRLMEPQPGSPLFQSNYLVSQLGVQHYHLRQFGPARSCFQRLHARDPFRIDDLDVYSNVLYVEEDRVVLSQLAHTAVTVDKYRPETCCIVGNYYSLKQQRQKAVLYFQRALKLDKHYMSAWTLMGHEYVELKNTAAAMEAYRQAVELAPHDYRAWYGLGQTYEFLSMPLYALYYYRKAVTLRPFDARMWCAMGLCFLALNRADDAVRCYERAINQGDSEGIATQKLASLYRQQGDNEKAAQCYMRHLELRYLITNPHAQSPNVTGGNNDISLDSIVQDVVLEAPEAEAMLYLASYHKQHGEYNTAALFCSRLLEYPGPEKEEAKAYLREIRSRKNHSQQNQQQARRMHTRSKGPPIPAWTLEEEEDNEKKDSGGESSFDFSP
jgi:anaphase-promoting complex subunit 8